MRGALSLCAPNSIVAFESIDNNNIDTGISYLFTTGGVEQNFINYWSPVFKDAVEEGGESVKGNLSIPVAVKVKEI